jgi:hypothetical protein
MNLKTKLAGSLMLFASASMAQAAIYNVNAVFYDGGMQGVTVFDGSFDWDGTSVSNFSGQLSESMWGWNTNLNAFAMDGMNPKGGLIASSAYTGNVYAKPGGYGANDAPLLNLSHQLAGGTIDPNTGLVTVTTFLQNSTDVVWFGGYDVHKTTVDFMGTPLPWPGAGNNAYGANIGGFWDGNARNNNGFFTLVFDPNDPTNTAATWNKMVYADDTALGMMGPMLTGPLGMTGFEYADPLYDPNDIEHHNPFVYGSMGGHPATLSIRAVAPATVPVPAAAWLFGSALMTLLGARRKRDRTMSVV